jgi:hypothetical protein
MATEESNRISTGHQKVSDRYMEGELTVAMK